jgi:hypothetical protein
LNAIAQLRRNVGGEVFDYQVLLDALAGYRKPRDRITRLLASGAIIRVKKGLYCFGGAKGDSDSIHSMGHTPYPSRAYSMCLDPGAV